LVISSDNHSHVIYDDIISIAKSASMNGLQSFSITEHITQFSKPRSEIKFGSVHTRGRMFVDFEEYLSEFEKLGGSFPKVNKGLEVDYSPRYEKHVSSHVNQEKWDILLVSVHELLNGIDIEDKKAVGDLNGSDSRWLEYLDLEKQALESKFVPFNVLTHPVRLARSTPKVPENFDDLLADLATVARENGKALELNGNDITRDFPFVERLAGACAKSNCKISFGSDAHHPAEVGRGLKKAAELVERYNLCVERFEF
jgi:HisJ family histidinol phosphate phosphatase